MSDTLGVHTLYYPNPDLLEMTWRQRPIPEFPANFGFSEISGNYLDTTQISQVSICRYLQVFWYLVLNTGGWQAPDYLVVVAI